VDVFAVDSNRQLEGIVLPFFEAYPLQVKANDFARFATIVRSLRRRHHYDRGEFERLVRIAYAVNHRAKQRKRSIEEILEGSSETVRQAPTPDLGVG
jgi:hypothetical protein